MIAKTFKEAARTLAPNGLLMWDYADAMYVDYAKQLGFEVVHWEPDYNSANKFAVLLRKVPEAEKQAAAESQT